MAQNRPQLSRLQSIPIWARQSLYGLAELGSASLNAYRNPTSNDIRPVRIQPHPVFDQFNSQPPSFFSFFFFSSRQPPRNEKLNPYIANRVTNTKYTLFTFFPKFCYEQFGRFMNFYFLMVASLQLIRQLTPINPVATWTPLLFIFALSGIKEAVDDYRRLLSDRAFNDRVYDRLSCDGQLHPIKSQSIQVGDILCIEEGDEIPCDLVLLKSNHERGEAMLLTSNLDGETNLKTLVAPSETNIKPLDQLGEFRAVIECPLPNPHLHSFDARLRVVGDTDWIPLGPQQLLLQGAVLKNTSRVYGVAVYTGAETKLGNNKQPACIKLTVLDRQIERASLLVFILQLIVVLLLGAVGNYLRRVKFGHHFYLHFKKEHGRAKTFITDLIIPLRMLLLLSLMIPISLKVSMDICKYLCSQFVTWDLNFYDPEGGSALVSNTSIADDLGQIEYLFTDKTGTLTENQMVYKGCTIGGRRYNQSGAAPTFENADAAEEYNRFYEVLSLCHSVQLSGESEGPHMFQGPSPDEEALVWAAFQANYQYMGRETELLKVKVHGVLRHYELLHTLEFSSARKRMSVIVRLKSDSPDEPCPTLLLTKGADDTIFPVCSSTSNIQKIKDQVLEYAHQGHRTLTVAFRVLSDDEYSLWLEGHNAAETSVQDRESAIEASAIAIEKDLTLLGGTAIEDRLQPDVPQTIASIRKAGIKVWMLTGDKLATAIQIGHSCRLLPRQGQGRIVVLSSEELSLASLGRQLESEVQNLPPPGNRPSHIQPPIPFSLVVDGVCLTWILDNPGLKHLFIHLSMSAQAVVCCRSTPKQKGEIVDAIKRTGKVTLAVGDGGNDIIMIQQANIGVGLRGREGRQAARAADLSLSRFKHLSRLLIVHGRYSLHRVRFVALYCFYKSIVVSMVQAGFQLFSGFSGSSLLTGYALSLYNVAYTGLPILLYVLDKDISEEVLMAQPELYENTPGRDPRYLLLSGTFRWFGWACFQGLATLFISIFLDWEGSPVAERGGGSMFSLSYLIYSAVVVTVQLTLAFATNYFTWLNQVVIFGGIIIYFVGTTLTSWVFPSLGMAEIAPLFLTIRFWLDVGILVSLLALPYWITIYLMYGNPGNPSRKVRLSTVLESRRRTIRSSDLTEEQTQPLLGQAYTDEPTDLSHSS